MGEMFRSEQMALCQMFVQTEAAYTTVSELGEIGCVQFRDMNKSITSSQRRFVGEVRRCDELERIIRYVQNEIIKDGGKIPDVNDFTPCAPNPREFAQLENELEKAETELIELSANDLKLNTNYLELVELREVLEHTEGFFSDKEVINFDSTNIKIKITEENRGRLGFVAGVINRERVFSFERMLWRISRGNIFVKRTDLTEPLKDPKTGFLVYKTIFVVFFQGDQLKGRIKKVCTGYHASTYPCSSSHVERSEMMAGVRTRLEDLKIVMNQSADHRKIVLASIYKNLAIWSVMVKKTKAIYHSLNLFNFDVTNKCMIGECWVPQRDLEQVQEALRETTKLVGSTTPSFLNVVETQKTPPTYFHTNKFTSGFQHLIDAYGVAKYREVNPALYTCITFPFLFAVMFGDFGHGSLMFLFALWMVLDEKRLGRKRGGEIWNILFSGRYIIMLMGLFAIYTGFLYNDIFSKSVNVFGSKWRIRYNTSTVLSNAYLQLDPKYATSDTYPLGMDPIWSLADNEIIFSNTFKMKLSIILGIIHMTLGVCLSVDNFVYFKHKMNILLEFIPQIIFLFLLFGYMCFMMFYKWVKYSPTAAETANTPYCAPSVLIMFINMVLFKTPTKLPGCELYMFGVQPTLQKIFVVVALICIPWMLFGKPFYVMCTRKRVVKMEKIDLDIELTSDKLEIKETIKIVEEHDEHDENDENEPISEVFIHQAIHTIEYILGTVSHTASYLRLWALSLAHAELSQVLWNEVLDIGLHFKTYTGSIALFFIFAIWAALTIAIMIMMEGLSAFLHTLRLHWVEFMSKFYAGSGYAFQPFSFKVILNEEED